MFNNIWYKYPALFSSHISVTFSTWKLSRSLVINILKWRLWDIYESPKYSPLLVGYQFPDIVLKIIIIIIIIRQSLCPVAGRRPQQAVSKLPSLVLSSAISVRSRICPGRLSTAWLVSIVVFYCHNGLQVVTREVHLSSLRRLICPVQDHFMFLTVLLVSMTLPSPWPRCWSFYPCRPLCDVEHTSFHFGLCGRKFVLCLFRQCPGVEPSQIE